MSTLLRRALSGVCALAAVGAAVPSASAADVVDGPQVHWNYSAWGKSRASSQIYDLFGEYMSERTGGKFTAQVHYGTLSKPRDNLDGIKLGAFQAATYCASYYPGKMEAQTGLDLPFLPINTLDQLAKVNDDFEEHPTSQAEFAKWGAKYYMSSVLPLYEVIGKGEPPDGLEGWKGKRIRALGPQGQAMELLGAVPTTVPAPEVYISMDRGLLDMAAFANYSLLAYRIYELGDWFTSGFQIGSIHCGFMMNEQAYNDLPDQYKQLMEEYRPWAYKKQVTALTEAEVKTGPETFREAGLQEIKFTPEDKAKFAEKAAKPVWRAWVEKMNDQGYNGQELLDLILSSAEKHKNFKF